MNERQEPTADPHLNPVEFLRRALAINPEDAASVREDAARLANGERGLSETQEHPIGNHVDDGDDGEDS